MDKPSVADAFIRHDGQVFIGPHIDQTTLPHSTDDRAVALAVATAHAHYFMLIDFREGRSSWPVLRQDGPTVFRWAVWEMAKVAREALDRAGVEPSDIAAFIPHQANMRIIDEFAKQL